MQNSDKNPSYVRFQPKVYKPEMSIFWWVKQKPYVLFILRELTSIFVAAYAILMMIQINALRQGPDAWESLIASFSSPLSIVLHIIVLAMILFHTFTWFNLTPTAMDVRLGSKRVPPWIIISVNIVVWLVLSTIVAWLILTA